jgi:hypothetical protein
MAIQEDKICNSCGIFCDCQCCNGKHFPPCYEAMEGKFKSLQQLKAEIAALANEIECRTRDQVSISPSMVVERLRQLLTV